MSRTAVVAFGVQLDFYNHVFQTSIKPASRTTRISTFHKNHLLKFCQKYSSGYSFTYKNTKSIQVPLNPP